MDAMRPLADEQYAKVNFRLNPERVMLLLLLVLMVWSGFAPADRTVWVVESVWSVGLLVILAVTAVAYWACRRRK